jgi:hypothetical protein
MPTVSKLHASGTMPDALTRPCVALSPTMPQYAAGRRVDPTVCEPRASGTMRALTAAAEPLDDPPGVCSTFHGLRVGVESRLANSVVVSWKNGPAPEVVTNPRA